MTMAVSITAATSDYERWVRRQARLIPKDLKLKHEQMAADPFSFLRATFYRWAELYPDLCPDLAAAPALLCVGDLHVENFGTWRDAEGRLIWGINDFDEATVMPYTIDLVRLATSALIAAKAEALAIKPEEASAAILAGYREGLDGKNGPYVLEESHDWLRKLALGELREPGKFWEKMAKLPLCRKPPPKPVRKMLERHLPEDRLDHRIVHRVAGLGSLGRERFVALAKWRGGEVAREAKALVPSGWAWARGTDDTKILCGKVVKRGLRCPDPTLTYEGGWVVRRLSPHCSRIELTHLPRERDEAHLLKAMGRETANIHLGARKAAGKVREDLAKRGEDWLVKAAATMAKAVEQDWQAWKKR
jgi:hypothetical protein